MKKQSLRKFQKNKCSPNIRLKLEFNFRYTQPLKTNLEFLHNSFIIWETKVPHRHDFLKSKLIHDIFPQFTFKSGIAAPMLFENQIKLKIYEGIFKSLNKENYDANNEKYLGNGKTNIFNIESSGTATNDITPFNKNLLTSISFHNINTIKDLKIMDRLMTENVVNNDHNKININKSKFNSNNDHIVNIVDINDISGGNINPRIIAVGLKTSTPIMSSIPNLLEATTSSYYRDGKVSYAKLMEVARKRSKEDRFSDDSIEGQVGQFLQNLGVNNDLSQPHLLSSEWLLFTESI
ncbi:uncharacterized protein SCDLUD_000409 [Saccharomycodes ludwigii]|uniref:uncharacterized protein n=1 Tax=Saccharomycodes ludwigii TaxID=36035 RepID=UPI001E893A84|nr:hypothetical protein SCDLUD_000409 [Saccharomycodes ludwigii]KAH3902817.1 hypothetical protein SCDLUD_000409 [Saccharomycodes ludwigii]